AFPASSSTAISEAEQELRRHIEESLEPLQKECMEWERRILHCANLSFKKPEEATKAWNQPTLPYALMKHEVQAARFNWIALKRC
ncbi:hypothetical protein, partial [Escherichia coli]|uniref:hypothetical protein n=1 Tax=Escherichia coli TaxID=562 RepID=UPI001AD8D88A